eukprot:1921400-Amphidinium_carterae.2
MDDLAHVVTQNMMADLLTKSSAPSDPLIQAVSSGTVPGADTNPPFRSTIRHHAFSSVYNQSSRIPDSQLLDTLSFKACVHQGQRITLMTDSGTNVLEDDFRKDGRKKVQEHAS